ncbi:MAG: hypothetical protein GY789_17920 [Hyphomicrobiales bacterium]|nr:hypothetical protein [Hyphomicrobiales bacterium]
MKIKRMRFVLPPRMRGTAHTDARLLANAAARALENGQISGGSVQVNGGGRSVSMVARDISATAHSMRRMSGRKV